MAFLVSKPTDSRPANGFQVRWAAADRFKKMSDVKQLIDSAGLLGVVAITHKDNRPARAVLHEAGLLPCSDAGLAARFDVQTHERLHLMARPADA
jgi:hypothetical protein